VQILIVEKNLRTEGFEHLVLADAAKEKGLVDAHPPIPQGGNDPGMGGAAARSLRNLHSKYHPMIASSKRHGIRCLLQRQPIRPEGRTGHLRS
jgi:hypothetical protein